MARPGQEIEDIVADIQRANYFCQTKEQLWQTLIEQIYEPLRRDLCYSKLRLNPEQQEDVLHEALYKIMEKIGTYDRSRGASFLTWCKVIVRNTGIDYRKKKHLYDESLEIVDNLHSQNSNPRKIEEDLIARQTFVELRLVIEQVLAGQPPHYRTAYELSLQGYAPGQIASHLNLKPKQVTDVLYRLKKLLQKAIRSD